MNKVVRAKFAAAPQSRLDMETLAESYLKRFYPENLARPRKLNVAELMDRIEELGIVFGVEDLPEGEEGHTNPLTKQIIVAPEVYQSMLAGDGRARQTCVHEVGHVQHIRQVNDIIRHGAPILARSINVVVPSYMDPEWQAHSVGSAMLMPRPTFDEVYNRGGVDAVSEFFAVSRSSAEVRTNVLRDLRVPKGQ